MGEKRTTLENKNPGEEKRSRPRDPAPPAPSKKRESSRIRRGTCKKKERKRRLVFRIRELPGWGLIETNKGKLEEKERGGELDRSTEIRYVTV